MQNNSVFGKLYGEGDVIELVFSSETQKIEDIKIADKKESKKYLDTIILPGLVDLHTHLREPGSTQSETIETGCKAAAAGGYTCVFAMANTTPTTDNAPACNQTYKIGREVGLAHVQPIGAVTKQLEGKKLSELALMAESDAKVRIFSDDGKCVSDPLLMRRALEYSKLFNGVIAQHSQDPRLTEDAQMNEGAISTKLGLQGWPHVAEESIIARDILLAQTTGGNLHICHVSTAGSVEIIRFAKSKGINVTAEVTPHHLSLTENCLLEYNPRYKVNPPLRTSKDIEALIEGVFDSTIDIIATDHAPHSLENKYCNFQESAFGMTGLETALRVAHAVLINNNKFKFNWRDIANLMSYRPAKIGQVSHIQGQELKIGSFANICVYDTKGKSKIIPQEQFTKSTNTPFKHQELPGKILQTVYCGNTTFLNKK